jgi:hypothetical protein
MDNSQLFNLIDKYTIIIKNAYFQGTEKPKPKQKQYKSDKAIVMQPRFKEPLYKNYDVYETEGVDGPAKHGPGAGYHHMNKYKSIKDFLKDKRKKLKDKYKADDSYIEDDGSITKNNILSRKSLLIKLGIDFPIDDNIKSGPILGDSGTLSDSVPIGGQLDEYLTKPDFEGKLPTELDFGRDYTEDADKSINKINELQVLLDELINKQLSPKETDLYGLPQGISPPEDLDAPSN